MGRVRTACVLHLPPRTGSTIFRTAIRPEPRRVELTALLAMSMALAALGIDLLLPAFSDIRSDLSMAPTDNAVTGLVTAYFLGLALGQLVYGPLADRFGRRPALFLGYAIYGIGALAGALLSTLTGLLVARFVWGLGAAGPRVVTLAVVRDRWEGEQMSRAMSFIMAVFILVPVVAPTLGAAAVTVVSWRVLFAGCVVAAALMAVWAVRRLPETLDVAHRLPLRFTRVARAAREVASHRLTVAYTLGMTAMYGAFTSYLGSSEAIFREVFDVAHLFPAMFGVLAAVMGGAMLVNARVVERFGTRRLAHGVLLGYLVAGGVLVAVAVASGGTPPLGVFMVAMGLMLSAHALLIPNFNAIAMAPMGAIAGTASSVIGAVQLAIGASLGALLDRAFDGTMAPLAYGFLGYGVVALLLVLWGEGGRLFQPLGRTRADTDQPDSGTEPVPARA